MMIVTIAWMTCLIMSVAGVMEAEPYPAGKKTMEGAVGVSRNRMKFYINENNGENHTGKADSITVGSRDRNKPITMEEVKILSAKNNLTLDDLYTYNNRQIGRGYSYYTFAYKGEDYTLDIYESDYAEIEGVRLVRQSDKLSIDIRNGNIDHLLSSEVSVWDYLSLQLPEGMEIGTYDMYMTGFGGSRIDNNATAEEEIPCGKIRLMHGDKLTFADGNITNVSFYDNCFSMLKKDNINTLEVPCLFMDFREEEEPATEWWAAYFAKEDAADIGYLIELRKDFFTREEVQNVIESVQFCERAFGNG